MCRALSVLNNRESSIIRLHPIWDEGTQGNRILILRKCRCNTLEISILQKSFETPTVGLK